MNMRCFSDISLYLNRNRILSPSDLNPAFVIANPNPSGCGNPSPLFIVRVRYLPGYGRLSMNMRCFSDISLYRNRNRHRNRNRILSPSVLNPSIVIANPDLSGCGNPSPLSALFMVRLRYRSRPVGIAMTAENLIKSDRLIVHIRSMRQTNGDACSGMTLKKAFANQIELSLCYWQNVP
jgi:hypothetical protein